LSPVRRLQRSMNRSITAQVHDSSSLKVGAALGQNAPQDTTGHNINSQSGSSRDAEPDLNSLLREIPKPGEAPTPGWVHNLSPSGRNNSAHQPEPLNAEVMLHKTRIMGWNRWMGRCQEVRSDALRCMCKC
jgi:hypothetical protein